ncbi:MAG: hypothetical protein JWN08_3367 [Frankiales bacterium]|nr:hypothetical protein [Frankiales bacterium]
MAARSSSRLQGVDAARGVALLGMVAVHVLPSEDPDGSVSLTDQLASGRSAAAFAVLAGVGLALASNRWDARRRLALVLRAALIGAVGLGLGALDSGVAVILAYYAVFFLLVQPFLGWRPRRLLLLAVALALLVPVISQQVRDQLPERDPSSPGFSRLGEPGPLLSELLLTGYYPAAAWLAYLVLGLAVGRLALHRAGVAVGIATCGAGLMASSVGASRLLLGPLGGEDELTRYLGAPPDVQSGFFGNVPTDPGWWLAVDAPHSTTPPDLAGTAGAALLVLGVALLVARRAAVLLAPLAAVGSMPLSLYTAHVVLLGLTDTDDPERYYLLQVAAAVAFALVWRRWLGRGPLEAVLAVVTRLVAGRSRT